MNKDEDMYDQVQGDVKFLRQDQILTERDSLINEAMGSLSLSKDETILALIHYKWSIEKLYEKWFDNVEEGKKKCGLIMTDSSRKQVNSLGVESNGNSCLICYDEKTPETANNFFSLKCGHVFCEGCWIEYLMEKSKHFSAVLQSTCPQQGGTCIVYESIFFKYLTDPEAIKRVKKGIIKNYIEGSKEIKYCPNPKCE